MLRRICAVWRLNLQLAHAAPIACRVRRLYLGEQRTPATGVGELNYDTYQVRGSRSAKTTAMRGGAACRLSKPLQRRPFLPPLCSPANRWARRSAGPCWSMPASSFPMPRALQCAAMAARHCRAVHAAPKLLDAKPQHLHLPPPLPMHPCCLQASMEEEEVNVKGAMVGLLSRQPAPGEIDTEVQPCNVPHS